MGNKLRIGSVRNACACSGERVQFVANIALPSPFFFFFLMQTSVRSSQSLGSWAAGRLGAHLWQVAGGRTRLESLLFLAVVPEERQNFLFVKALDKRVCPTGLLD